MNKAIEKPKFVCPECGGEPIDVNVYTADSTDEGLICDTIVHEYICSNDHRWQASATIKPAERGEDVPQLAEYLYDSLDTCSMIPDGADEQFKTVLTNALKMYTVRLPQPDTKQIAERVAAKLRKTGRLKMPDGSISLRDYYANVERIIAEALEG